MELFYNAIAYSVSPKPNVPFKKLLDFCFQISVDAFAAAQCQIKAGM